MGTTSRLAAAVVTITLVSAAAVTAQDDAMAEMNRRVEASIRGLIAFVAGVELDEARLQRVLEHAPALSQIGDDEDDEEIMERAYVDGRYDLRVILSDPELQAFCRARGLAAERFFKDLLRLESLVMRQESLRDMRDALDGIPEQRRQWEAMRARMGEEAYKAAVSATEASAASLTRSIELIEQIPAPSQEEARLLREYADAISQALGNDEEPDEGFGEAWPESSEEEP